VALVTGLAALANGDQPWQRRPGGRGSAVLAVSLAFRRNGVIGLLGL
jgi:hypothetical protein